MTPTMNSPRIISLRHLSHNLLRRQPHPKARLSPLQTRLYSSSTDSMPKIAQTSFWTSLVPKFLRNRPSKDVAAATSPKSKEWNPASYYIIIFILIGSQAIRMLALKHDYAAFVRSTDAKASLLREVIEKVQRGEEVDVGKMLGTGDEAKEREWEDVLRELAEEDSIWHKKKKGDSKPEPAGQSQPDHAASSIPPSDSRPKDPVVPAEGNPADNPQTTGDAARKSNFF